MTWRIYQEDADPVPDIPNQTGTGTEAFSFGDGPSFSTWRIYQFNTDVLLDVVAAEQITWFCSLSAASHDTWRIYEEMCDVLEDLDVIPPLDSWFEKFSDPVWAKPALARQLHRANIDCIFRVPLSIQAAMNVTETKDIAAITVEVDAEPPPPPGGSASVVIIEIPLYNREGAVSIREP